MADKHYSDGKPSRLGHGVERRVLERLSAEEQATVRLLDVHADAPVTHHACNTLDISPSGMRVFTRQRLDVGEHVEITITPAASGRQHKLEGIVRWHDPSTDAAGYLVGVELINQRSLRAWCREFH